jgi:hypothetical protein
VANINYEVYILLVIQIIYIFNISIHIAIALIMSTQRLTLISASCGRRDLCLSFKNVKLLNANHLDSCTSLVPTPDVDFFYSLCN